MINYATALFLSFPTLLDTSIAHYYYYLVLKSKQSLSPFEHYSPLLLGTT